jgi:hypothetical protein
MIATSSGLLLHACHQEEWVSDQEYTWVPVATFPSGLEADLALAMLDSAGIVAIRRDNDIVGIFGPGFQGPSARGVEVLVPSDAVEEAQRVLTAESDDEEEREEFDDEEL